MRHACKGSIPSVNEMFLELWKMQKLMSDVSFSEHISGKRRGLECIGALLQTNFVNGYYIVSKYLITTII